MSDLLSIGKTGVLAYRDALSGISENVVNANNDGFSKRQVVLKEQTSGSGPLYLYRNSASFNGVQAAQVNRVWDQYKATSAWDANSDASSASTKSQYLSTVETTLDDSDSGLGVKLTAIFTSANALAANPNDTTLRQGMLYSLSDAAGTLGQTSANLTKVSNTVGDRASDTVAAVNNALVSLAKLNVTLKTSPAGTSGRAALEDQRDTLIGSISGNLGVDVTFDSYGAVTLKLNDFSGQPLVSDQSDTPAMLSMARGTDGQLSFSLTTAGLQEAASPTSGTLAGLASAATSIAGRVTDLDGIAKSLHDTFKTFQESGQTPAGVAGVSLFTGTTATTLKLTMTDPAGIAASDGTADNGNLLLLAQQRTGGIEDTWHAIVTDQSLQVSAAKGQETTTATQKDNAYSALDETSGVDLDAEAADLIRFQQAYSASAKIIQTARDTLQTVLQLF